MQGRATTQPSDPRLHFRWQDFWPVSRIPISASSAFYNQIADLVRFSCPKLPLACSVGQGSLFAGQCTYAPAEDFGPYTKTVLQTSS